MRRLEAVGVVWDLAAAQWERNFELLRAFVAREGHANVPRRHVEDGENLGSWLSNLRKRYAARDLPEAERKKNASPLSDEEVRRLEELSVVWDVAAARWERMFELLRACVAREGHADVPDSHVEEGENLGGWLSRQRTRYAARDLPEAERRRRKSASPLSDDEVRRLVDLGVRLETRKR